MHSLRAGHQGLTIAIVKVDTSGAVSSVEIERSPDEEIATSVRRSMAGWRFRSTTIKGVAHPAWARTFLYFKVNKFGKPQIIIPGLTDREP